MMRIVLTKHLAKDNLNKPDAIIREIAGVKCIIDFRIAYYDIIGKSPQKYLEAALELHK